MPGPLSCLKNNMDVIVNQAEKHYYNCDFRECCKITTRSVQPRQGPPSVSLNIVIYYSYFYIVSLNIYDIFTVPSSLFSLNINGMIKDIYGILDISKHVDILLRNYVYL